MFKSTECVIIVTSRVKEYVQFTLVGPVNVMVKSTDNEYSSRGSKIRNFSANLDPLPSPFHQIKQALEYSWSGKT